MALSFLNNSVVSDLCLGKPPLAPVLTTLSSVKDVLTALKSQGCHVTHVSVWGLRKGLDESAWCCVGKVSVADVICFLCEEGNFECPVKALEAPVSVVLEKGVGVVRHLESYSSLLEAIDCILEGSQNLVIPIQGYTTSKSMREYLKKDAPSSLLSINDSIRYCWLTQEDIARFLLNSIGVFSPETTFTIESLNIIDREVMSIYYDDPASLALSSISRAISDQTCVAVIDAEKRLVGEISPYTLASCDETVAAAIMTLSAGDLMAYIDCGGPPDGLVQLVKSRLEEKGFNAMMKVIDELYPSSYSSSSSSSDDESGSPSSRNGYSYSHSFSRSSSSRRSEAIMCFPWSSLVAVIFQALAHRVSYVWVVEDDQTLVGMVTFQEMFKVFRSVAGEQHKGEMKKSFKQ